MEKAVATAPVKCPPAKFYNFFKSSINDLLKVVPAVFTGVELLEGVEGQVGCVKLWKYTLGGLPLTAKVKLAALDDAGFSLTFSVLEGDLLLLYKSFSVTLVFTDGLAKCTFSYEKKTLLSPPPDAYVALIIAVFTLLDAYLLLH